MYFDMMLDRKKFYKFYDSIMNLNDKIRFVTIADKSCVIIFGGQREGVENYLSDQAQKKSIKHILNSGFLRNELSEEIDQKNMPQQNMKKSKDLCFH